MVREAYGTDLVEERHRHRYEVNNAYRDRLAESGMRLSGFRGFEELGLIGGTGILTVSGRITHGNGRTADGQNEARFDRAMLLRLGITEFETETPWHNGQVRFEGVLIRRLLAAVGAQGRSLYARAHNDYSVELPVDDVERYDVILALRANGRDLRLRDALVASGSIDTRFSYEQCVDPRFAEQVVRGNAAGSMTETP